VGRRPSGHRSRFTGGRFGRVAGAGLCDAGGHGRRSGDGRIDVQRRRWQWHQAGVFFVCFLIFCAMDFLFDSFY
jgi:hypothetical protein